MRKARSEFSYPPDAPYHHVLCHSALGGPWPGMETEELYEVRDLLLEHAAFCSIEILAFSMRPRSFDLLLKVPGILKLSKKEMLSRLESNFDPVGFQNILAKVKSGDPAVNAQIAQNFGSTSFFLKRFKQVITRNYHRNHQSSGILWEARYSSTFVEPGHASRVIAAWIDHGITRENPSCLPKESPLCTIGWAHANGKPAREMIGKTFLDHDITADWPATRKAWDLFVSSEPENAKTRTSNLSGKAPLNRSELLRFPVPHFLSGLAIGSHDFVQRLFDHNRSFFAGDRETGPRFVNGQNDPTLFALRDKGDLRKPPRSLRAQRAL